MIEKRLIAAGVLAIAVCGIARAQDTASTAPTATQAPALDPKEEMTALRARIDQLEARQAEANLKAAQNTTVRQLEQDADRHGQLMDVSGFSAGYKNGRFFLGSDDGNFLWQPFIQIQVRDVTLNRQDFKTGKRDDTQNGFEIRRLRFGFDGNLFSPDLTYYFNWGTQRASGSANVVNSTGTKIGTVSNSLGGVLVMEEAWAKYHFGTSPLYIRAGQIRDPLIHDEIIRTVKQQSTERPITTDIFANAEGLTEAATLIFDPKTWMRTEVGVNHGLRSANTNFLDYPNSNAFNYGVVGRAEFKVMGKWAQYEQIGAVDVTEPLLVIGVGADYSERGHSGQTVGVVDVMYADQHGLSFYGGVVDRYTNHNFGIYTVSSTGANIAAPPAAVLNRATNEYAGFLQAGYLIQKHWEPYGRFEYIHVAGTAAGSDNYFPVIAGGMNYYFYGHRCKVTAQVTYLPDGIPFDDTPNDVLALPSGKGEISGQVQFQLVL